LDTRSKIISREAALELAASRKLLVVQGSFDVLLASHALALQKVRDGTPGAALMLVLTPPSVPLLSDCARAELAAALHMVDYVVIGGPEEFGGRLSAAQWMSRQREDEELVRLLMEHVHRRHNL
jgi:bifunctional ADP-heptose synthase (sugar kinase/adenylyltransferase)